MELKKTATATVPLYAKVIGKRWFTPEHAKALKEGGRGNWQKEPFPAEETVANDTSNVEGAKAASKK